jgi:hypothetical protein
VSEGFALHNLGGIYWESGRFDYSQAYFQEALAGRRQTGDRHGEATTLLELGSLSTVPTKSASRCSPGGRR